MHEWIGGIQGWGKMRNEAADALLSKTDCRTLIQSGPFGCSRPRSGPWRDWPCEIADINEVDGVRWAPLGKSSERLRSPTAVLHGLERTSAKRTLLRVENAHAKLVNALWALYVGGRLAERVFGGWAFALLYFASGLAGSISFASTRRSRHRSFNNNAARGRGQLARGKALLDKARGKSTSAGTRAARR